MSKIILREEEIDFSAIRAQGSGGQNVNKVSTALHLRFDIRASSLPDIYKQRLLALNDSRITKEGVVVIKAQQHRSQDKNREEGIARLLALLESVTHEPVIRRATKPTRASQRRRMDGKTLRGEIKSLRGKIVD
ncbi:Peptidyl-tRNA hydrolase ArfB [Andreprevotia sp. IGB-42]|uniref:alternative ribosome rescue aminoacyl-tRNA hydrolase ArfB n=1 Tax=Andreprevotia sp. IGB-42 TaxID=2497473 RepID=UPI00135CE371|nr:alternative ribosome rescue aminoacyl-tRNA hydrolase ArfB [Andreprevotia sp. IGB-42]KAF0814903.1 Peptidyl-tRNA hydrolase ArfB [Andreprevotia sp. IGB-42]